MHMSLFIKMCDSIVNAGRSLLCSSEYRIVFVRRGHPVLRRRRLLRDARTTVCAPFTGNPCVMKLSTMLDAIRSCCGATNSCTLERLASSVAREHSTKNIEPLLHALAERNYIDFNADRVTIL
jgi:hypothetical protein